MYLTSLQLVSVHRHGHVHSVNVEITFHLECKLCFPWAQLMLRQILWPKLSVSADAKYWVSWPSLGLQRTWKLPWITADSKSRWPHGRKAYFDGVLHSSAPQGTRVAERPFSGDKLIVLWLRWFHTNLLLISLSIHYNGIGGKLFPVHLGVSIDRKIVTYSNNLMWLLIWLIWSRLTHLGPATLW